LEKEGDKSPPGALFLGKKKERPRKKISINPVNGKGFEVLNSRGRRKGHSLKEALSLSLVGGKKGQR